MKSARYFRTQTVETRRSTTARLNAALCVLLGCVGVMGCGSTADTSGKESADRDTSQVPAVANSQELMQSNSSQSLAATSTSKSDADFGDALFGVDSVLNTPADSQNTMHAVDPQIKIPEVPLPLRADLSPAKLADFLKLCDLEMQSIASGKAGIFDRKKASDEMIKVGKLKLEAAKRLQANASTDAKQKVLGIRGELQSLSHLAALGELKSAKELETLATSLVENDDASIAEDSRLVLIGLSLERIQNGTDKNADAVMAQIKMLGADGNTPNVAAMMIMGQARAVLEKYGFTEQSTVVRNRIVDLFAAHEDPNVASLAIEIAGTPRFAEVDRMLRSLERGEVVTPQTWRTTIDGLLSESPDLSAIQFVAGAALQNEAAGREDLVDATYESLQAAKNLGAQEQKEIGLAIAARNARKSIIGQLVDFDLPSTDGRPLSMSSYAGRIVVMPFWSINFAESLSVLQTLGELRDHSDGKVEIIGVNLDADDELLSEFMAKSPIEFRSYYSQSKHGTESVNETAEKFGVVSMPFIAIIDQNGTVTAIDFTGQRVKEIVDRLISTP